MSISTRDILVAISRPNASPNKALGLGDALAGFNQWDALIFDANREGMTGLLYRGIQQSGFIQAVPPRIVERLASIYYHTVSINSKLMADFEEIIQNSYPRGIEPIAIQGISLQGDVYSDPGVRPMSDIDLCVDPSAFNRFSELLTGLGYQQDSLYSGSFVRGTTKLDVHTHLFWADRLKSYKWLTRKDASAFIENTESYRLGRASAKRLYAVNQALYLGMHTLKHNADRLIWLVDISRLLAGMSAQTADQLLTRAETFGLTHQMGYVGILIKRLLGEKTILLAWERAVGPLASWVLRHRDRRGALPGWSPLVLFTAGKNIRFRLKMPREMMFPDSQVLRQVFADAPSAPIWRLYLYRLRQMIAMLQ